MNARATVESRWVDIALSLLILTAILFVLARAAVASVSGRKRILLDFLEKGLNLSKLGKLWRFMMATIESIVTDDTAREHLPDQYELPLQKPPDKNAYDVT